MRAEQALRQVISHLHIVPPALVVTQIAQHLHPGEAAGIKGVHVLVRPFRFGEVGLVHAFPACLGAVADRGGALLGNLLAVLVHVIVVAALEHGRPEARFLDHIVKRDAVVGDGIAGLDARAIEPPFIPAEQQVGFRNLADAGRACAVAVVGRNGEALRGDQLAEPAFVGELRIEVQQVRVVHGMYPTPDIVPRDRFAQERLVHRLSEVVVDIRNVEFVSHYLASFRPDVPAVRPRPSP